MQYCTIMSHQPVKYLYFFWWLRYPCICKFINKDFFSFLFCGLFDRETRASRLSAGHMNFFFDKRMYDLNQSRHFTLMIKRYKEKFNIVH